MIEQSLSRELKDEIESARAWGREHVRPAGLEADRAGAPLPPDHPFFARCVAEGRTRARVGLTAPEGTTVRLVVVAEELAYWDRGIGVATPGVGLPGGITRAMATPEQKARFLAPFETAERPMWASFALTEPSGGSDTAAFRTAARRDGDSWVLNGAKCFIGNASRAEWILVQAQTDPAAGRAGQRQFFVERGTPGLGGFRIEKKMGLRAYESTSFVLEDVRVPDENLLGEKTVTVGSGYKQAMGTLNATRCGVAANATGIARAALDEATTFARQAGLLSRSRVRDRLELARRRVRAAALMTLQAARMVDTKTPNIAQASMAKVYAAEVAQEVAGLGLEIVALAGDVADCLLEKLYRDAKAMNIVEGTAQIQRAIIARQLVGTPL
jgi:acyl-CoA dehydrogenase